MRLRVIFKNRASSRARELLAATPSPIFTARKAVPRTTVNPLAPKLIRDASDSKVLLRSNTTSIVPELTILTPIRSLAFYAIVIVLVITWYLQQQHLLLQEMAHLL